MHEIMQFCHFGGAGTSYTLSERVRDYYTRTNEIYVDRLGVLPIGILMNRTKFLEWL